MTGYLGRPSQTVVYFGEPEGGPTVWSAWSLSSLCSRNFRCGAARPKPGQATNRSAGSNTTERPSAQTAHFGPRFFRRTVVAAVAGGTAFASVALLGAISAPVASAAASAPVAAQCNPADGYPTTAPLHGAGREVSCNISVVNSVSSSGAPSSTITTTACLAAAGVLPPAGCTARVASSTQLVSTVNQCNGIIVGGGSNLICNVTFTNDVSTGTPTSGATVNQCIGSGTGGGTEPTVVCAPVANTTNATVTQCNGSGNGGGGTMRVKCTVSGAATALPVTINQCNGSSNGGGSTVTCTTTIANNFLVPSATTTGTTPPSGAGGSGTTGTPGAGGTTPGAGGTTPGAGGTTPGAGGTTPGGSGVTGLIGSAAPAGGSTNLGTTGVIPSGAPQTGLGGASHSRNDALLFAGMLSLIGAGLALAVALGRRRTLSFPGADETT